MSMLFDSKGEFIQALKDYYTFEQLIKKNAQTYRDVYYLRYEKVRSPLDYDIVGYNKKTDEPIRQIKGRSSFSQETVMALQEQLDDKLEMLLDKNTELKKKMQKINDELKSIDEPLRSILILRYREKTKLKDICKKYNLTESGLHKYIDRGLDKYYG